MSKRHRTSSQQAFGRAPEDDSADPNNEQTASDIPGKSFRARAFGLAPRRAWVDPTNQQTAEDILRRSFRVGSPRRLGGPETFVVVVVPSPPSPSPSPSPSPPPSPSPSPSPSWLSPSGVRFRVGSPRRLGGPDKSANGSGHPPRRRHQDSSGTVPTRRSDSRMTHDCFLRDFVIAWLRVHVGMVLSPPRWP